MDLYVWKNPRGIDEDQAAELVKSWHEQGGDPATGPFEASDDLTWFFRELIRDVPELDVTTDATPIHGRLPVWLAGAVSEEPAPKSHVAVIHLPPQPTPDLIEEIFGLGIKYDVVVFDPQRGRLYEPMAQMSEYASATFWPAGAIRAFLAGAVGVAIAVGGWLLGIPLLNIIALLVGGFLVVMSVLTFVVEGRATLRRRGGSAGD